MPFGDTTSPEIERVAKEIVDSAFKIHRKFGPGLLEVICETCLEYELRKRGLKVDRQAKVPIVYDGVVLDASLRMDLLVEDLVVVELKSVETMIPLFEAQLLTCLKLTSKRLGILINFNVAMFKDGVKRVVL